jgi:hypothetical protein
MSEEKNRNEWGGVVIAVVMLSALALMILLNSRC